MELAQTVVYLKNRSPTTAVSTTPYEEIFTILKGVSSRDKVFSPGRMRHLFDFCSYPVLFVETELFRGDTDCSCGRTNSVFMTQTTSPNLLQSSSIETTSCPLQRISFHG